MVFCGLYWSTEIVPGTGRNEYSQGGRCCGLEGHINHLALGIERVIVECPALAWR